MNYLYAFGKVWAGILVLYLLCSGTATACGVWPMTADAITTQTSAFLQKFVDKEGKVNYASIQHNPAQLDDLLNNIAHF
jgi:hypothetical protein